MRREVRSRILNDPYYRLQSLAEVRLAAELGMQVDVNRACVDDWLRLPGLSIHQARSLVSLNQAGVQFHCIEDIAAALSLPIQRLLPLAPLLQFCYYEPETSNEIQRLNLNAASPEMLTRIPGVDLGLAQAIVHHRLVYGPYRSIADLQQRLGLPGSLVAELMHYLQL